MAATWRVGRTNDSSGVAAALRPSTGYREDMIKRGVAPRDFVKENRKRIQLKQAEQAQKKADDEAKATAKRAVDGFKIKRFERAASRVGSYDGDDRSSTSSQHTRYTTHRREYNKARVPTQDELRERDRQLKEAQNRQTVDFINSNAWEVIQKAPKKPTPTAAELWDIESRRHHSFGQVPSYLRERKAAWAKEEEERRMNLPDPDCPHGMVLMADDDRLDTLATLRESYEAARRQMNQLPLRIETPSQIRRKQALETKMQEIEDAIKVFDKPKVFMLPEALSESTTSA
ncbi:hypothetical protein SPRG_07433 [Saprolegnia parasitica CBS 223.65]|uniref:Enkurin domain-containing protein n=1 Tax=Saprolegnia parasitica (strain CBS 223.65) TaxID=695850 RepID=A0A067C8X7_SAPPC|nr:hypothetical protein SPRG_07433 [Saprolegnia parasitica CBS 223.65]KDO27184.1 hypothetical protein SPRG_07433 [Saprolegnia parasitica CBS 223.65]|eukprot:XP_012201962.1 hypothetical protein SPRG_07433 [Saprolegnia parasitica CBS 223.65]